VRVLLDMDVILDLLLDRTPFSQDAAVLRDFKKSRIPVYSPSDFLRSRDLVK